MTKKFRIWDNNQNKYRESSGELRLSRTFETFCLGLHFQRESLDDSPWASDLEIEQFTGLLDSTGKEIYEGDLVKSGAIKGIVNFEQGAFFVGDELLFNAYVLLTGKIFVIGNIHENNT